MDGWKDDRAAFPGGCHQLEERDCLATISILGNSKIDLFYISRETDCESELCKL